MNTTAAIIFMAIVLGFFAYACLSVYGVDLENFYWDTTLLIDVYFENIK